MTGQASGPDANTPSPQTPGLDTDEVTELDRTDDVDVALRRVVEFEADHDAPAYFDDRLTILESVADSGE